MIVAEMLALSWRRPWDDNVCKLRTITFTLLPPGVVVERIGGESRF
jgi:hypothetical protein